MKTRWTLKAPLWLTKLAGVKTSLTSPHEYGPKLPRGRQHRALRHQWMVVCIAFGILLNVGMYFGLRWSYPSEEQMNFRQEVSTLLSIQGYMVARKPDEGIPSMDSIRDVIFGAKTVGAALRQGCRDMLKAREKIELDPVLANTIEQSLRRWEQAEKELQREQTVFIVGFLTLSLGAPALVFLLALPLYAKARGRMELIATQKRAARESARRAATKRAMVGINRKRRAASSTRSDDVPE